ncbi:MAG: thermonuclease family protein [bacterium]|nr:thermonuclease family protein [bacterium]
MRKTVLLALSILVLGFTLLGAETRPITATPTPAQLADVATSMAAATTTPPHPQNTYPVVKVIDGDTISIMREGKTVTLRLIGLDTPETVDPRKPVQCFGRAASDKAKEVLTGKMVRLEFDASQGLPSFAEASEGTVDKYGRTLAYVFLPAQPGVPSEIFVNAYMIAEGYGHEYTYNLPYKYQKEFKEAEVRARAEKRGLWADDTCGGNTKKSASS